MSRSLIASRNQPLRRLPRNAELGRSRPGCCRRRNRTIRRERPRQSRNPSDPTCAPRSPSPRPDVRLGAARAATRSGGCAISPKRSSAPAAVRSGSVVRGEKWLAPTDRTPSYRPPAHARHTVLDPRQSFGARPLRAHVRKRSGLGFPPRRRRRKNVEGEHCLVARRGSRAQSLMPARRATHTRAQAFDRLPRLRPFQFAPKRGQNLARKLVTKILGAMAPEFDFDSMQGRSRPSPQEAFACFPDRSGERRLRQPAARDAERNHFAVDKNAVAIENANSGQRTRESSSQISRSVRRSISQARRFRAWNAAIARLQASLRLARSLTSMTSRTPWSAPPRQPRHHRRARSTGSGSPATPPPYRTHRR